MRPLDAAAMSAAEARGAAEAAVWLAGVTGDPGATVRERVLVVAPELSGPPPLSVPEVAAAVDRGRALAAAAAGDGCTVLRARGAGGDGAHALADWLRSGSDAMGPLRALRRLGDEEAAVLCGAALGAGEHGLAYVYDDLAGEAAAAIAVAVEPALEPRVRPARAL
jgi:nicotinate-nucleotide--dimethylbenzimidazole phosphoribosyltransferase